MYLPKMVVAFDDAEPVEVQCTSRDLLKMEADGVDLNEMKAIEGTYTFVWYALRRLQRTGKLPDGIEVPEDVTDFLDMADISQPDEADPEGNGSAPEATTGS